ncbi:MAG TPA: T9SS type A sorting domain-containing protein [Bacteroidota bacterium]|nr:T9SS type A sorting domain-containing protein [Bacteroidota bacterium]
MKTNLTRSARLAMLLVVASGTSVAQVPGNQDTIYIPGDTFHGREHAGLMEAAINGDTTSTGARINPNRVYALYQGQYYHQLAPISVNNPTGTLTICGVPSASGKTKPAILIAPTPPNPWVGVDAGGVNLVYGSIKFDGIHYQAQQLNGALLGELFRCGTETGRHQTLTINNCLFEFCGIDLFDCTNETGNIGGWRYGASFFITNSYFRNMFEPSQWWSSRVFQCKHPIDTLWVENCTVTTGGLTFLQQNGLTDFMYINHNTIVNNRKYWLLSPYYHYMFITNNIFMNQNWVGEDTNITSSGSVPYRNFQSTIILDTCDTWHLRELGLTVQAKYMINDSTINEQMLGFAHMRVYISDNINYWDPLLINGYYNSSKYVLSSIGALPSYLDWTGWGSGPWRIENVPCEWMNTLTQGIFADWGPGKGGIIEKRTSTDNPGTITPSIADPSVVDSMAAWNQAQWADPRFPSGAALQNTKYIYGDYDPTTLPGIVSGVRTDKDTSDGAGISKFTDLTENFSQSSHISAIDGFPIGALIWDDAQLAAYNSENAVAAMWNKYDDDAGFPRWSVQPDASEPLRFALLQNYPNPFNPSTTIRYSIPKEARVRLSVFNVLGQLVATLVNQTQLAGEHEVRFDGSGLASGVYIYSLSSGSFVKSMKLLLVR